MTPAKARQGAKPAYIGNKGEINRGEEVGVDQRNGKRNVEQPLCSRRRSRRRAATALSLELDRQRNRRNCTHRPAHDHSGGLENAGEKPLGGIPRRRWLSSRNGRGSRNRPCQPWFDGHTETKTWVPRTPALAVTAPALTAIRSAPEATSASAGQYRLTGNQPIS